MLAIRLDSIDSRRFVCLDVDPSYRKSISRRLEKNSKYFASTSYFNVVVRVSTYDDSAIRVFDPSYQKSISGFLEKNDTGFRPVIPEVYFATLREKLQVFCFNELLQRRRTCFNRKQALEPVFF